MGHDARFRGQLNRALAAGSWDNRVDWFIDGSTALRVTVTDALAHVARLIGRDWTDKVVSGASRLAKRPVTAAPSRPSLPDPSPSSPSAAPSPSGDFDPVDATERRMDELMRKLSRPMVGKWGWLDVTTLIDGPLVSEPSLAGRVVHTHRDPELDASRWHIDVFVPELRKTFIEVSPEHFRVDESARSA
jgi:hypothetical protein